MQLSRLLSCLTLLLLSVHAAQLSLPLRSSQLTKRSPSPGGSGAEGSGNLKRSRSGPSRVPRSQSAKRQHGDGPQNAGQATTNVATTSPPVYDLTQSSMEAEKSEPPDFKIRTDHDVLSLDRIYRNMMHVLTVGVRHTAPLKPDQVYWILRSRHWLNQVPQLEHLCKQVEVVFNKTRDEVDAGNLRKIEPAGHTEEQKHLLQREKKLEQRLSWLKEAALHGKVAKTLDETYAKTEYHREFEPDRLRHLFSEGNDEAGKFDTRLRKLLDQERRQNDLEPPADNSDLWPERKYRFDDGDIQI